MLGNASLKGPDKTASCLSWGNVRCSSFITGLLTSKDILLHRIVCSKNVFGAQMQNEARGGSNGIKHCIISSYSIGCILLCVHVICLHSADYYNLTIVPRPIRKYMYMRQGIYCGQCCQYHLLVMGREDIGT